MPKATISFRVGKRVKELYDKLSGEDKEKIKRFVELLVEILYSGYSVEVREKREGPVAPPKPASPEPAERGPTTVAAPQATPVPGSMLQRIFKEWYQALVEQGFVPGQLYKCQELQVALAKRGVQEYALEVLVKQGYVVRDGDECVLK